MEEDNQFDYSLTVHQSLMEKNVLFGIGSNAFYSILIVTILLCSLLSIYCIAVGIIAFVVCRQLCKKEPMLLEFLFENLNQQDVYEG